MASPVYTYFGTIVVLKNTQVDVSDDVIEATLEGERAVPSVDVYGPSQTRTAAGSLKWTGKIRCVYDYSSANTGYRILHTEFLTPTAGGLYVVFKPTGEGAGEQQRSFYAVLSGESQPDAGAGDIQKFEYPFTVNGQPTDATQTT